MKMQNARETKRKLLTAAREVQGYVVSRLQYYQVMMKEEGQGRAAERELSCFRDQPWHGFVFRSMMPMKFEIRYDSSASTLKDAGVRVVTAEQSSLLFCRFNYSLVEGIMGSVGGMTGKDDRVIFFFDIDNCLYKKSKNVHDHMARLINDYFTKHFSEMTSEQATQLHLQYYKDYGLAIEGLARHHQVDPLDFNREVDDALPLDDLLSPDCGSPRDTRELRQDQSQDVAFHQRSCHAWEACGADYGD